MHIDEVHLNLYKFVCQVCGKKCKKSGELYDHFRTTGHVNEKPEVAVQPEKKLDAKIVLPFLQKSGKDGDEDVRCKLCNYTEYCDDVMVKHFEENHREDLKNFLYDYQRDEVPVQCIRCNGVFKNRIGWVEHECPEELRCKQKLQPMQTYRNFTRSVDGIYRCKFCTKESNSFARMVVHFEQKHKQPDVSNDEIEEQQQPKKRKTHSPPVGNYRCTPCDFTAKSFVDMWIHKKNKHIDEQQQTPDENSENPETENYEKQCDFCPLTFNSFNESTMHSLDHLSGKI